MLNIWQYTPPNILPVFEYSDVMLDIVVGGAAVLFKHFKIHKHGKRASVLIKLRQRYFRTALPSIHLANLHSLPNKTNKLLLLTRINKDFSNSLCSHSGQRVKSAMPPAVKSGSRRRINREIAWWWDMVLP